MPELTQETLLQEVNNGTITSSRDLCNSRGWDHEQFVGVLKSLVSREMVQENKTTSQSLTLTPEGQAAVDQGSPEYLVFSKVLPDGIPKPELEVSITLTHLPTRVLTVLSLDRCGQVCVEHWLQLLHEEQMGQIRQGHRPRAPIARLRR